MVLVSGILVGAEVSPVEWLFLQEGSTLLGVEESTSRRPRAIGLSPAYPQEKPTWMERAWTAGLGDVSCLGDRIDSSGDLLPEAQVVAGVDRELLGVVDFGSEGTA